MHLNIKFRVWCIINLIPYMIYEKRFVRAHKKWAKSVGYDDYEEYKNDFFVIDNSDGEAVKYLN